MDEAVDVMSTLGARVAEGSRDGDWTRMLLGDAETGLLAHPPNPDQDEGTVELNFSAPDRPVTDEGFGRQLQLRGPDRLLMKVNELEPTLYR